MTSSQAFHWNRQHKSHAYWFGQKFIDLCFVFCSKSVKTGNPSKDIPDVAIQLTFRVMRFLFECLRASWVRWSPRGLWDCRVCRNLCGGHGVYMDPALQLWNKSRCVEPLGAGTAVPRSRWAPLFGVCGVFSPRSRIPPILQELWLCKHTAGSVQVIQEVNTLLWLIYTLLLWAGDDVDQSFVQ